MRAQKQVKGHWRNKNKRRKWNQVASLVASFVLVARFFRVFPDRGPNSRVRSRFVSFDIP